MKFSFKDIPVEVTPEGELKCEDAFTKDILQPVINRIGGSPQDGEPVINTLVEIFGETAITDVQYVENDDIIH